MIRFAAPGFLVAGALLALVPLALHMLARTPPERRPLPTARFLSPDRRTRLRLRRPSDLLLMAMRMGLILLLGAAFARPSWLPARTGSATIVLLDVGAGMAGDRAAALDAARVRLAGGGGTLVAFDTAARVATEPGHMLDSLATATASEAPSSYLAALRGLRAAAAGLAAESASAVIITRARWSAWSPAIPVVRATAWPGSIELVEVGSGSYLGSGSDSVPAGEAVVLGEAGQPLGAYVRAALLALGFTMPEEPGGTPALAVSLSGFGGAEVEAERMVILADVEAGAASGAWDPAPDGGAPGGGRLVFADGVALSGWRRQSGGPGDGARVVAVWEDGRPAAAAVESADGCVSYLAAEPAEAAAAADPGFPRLIRALADACDGGTVAEHLGTGTGGAAAPLDEGARAVLAGDSLPAAASLDDLDERTARPLTRVLLALALLLAGIETVVAYRGWRTA